MMTNTDAERVSEPDDQHRFVVVSADYSRPFMVGAYPTLQNAILAQGGSPAKWHIFERHPAADIIEAQSKALAEAREALKPFAEFVPDFFDDGYQDDDIVSITSHHGGLDLTLTVGDFRRARAAATPTPENPNERR